MDLFTFLDEASTVKVDPKPWMTDGSHKLIRATATLLPAIIDECIASGLYSLDLEATSLDTRVFDGSTVSKIVGCCLSSNGKVGYYIPLRHKLGLEHNVPWTLWKTQMHRLIKSEARAIFHHGKFDQELLQFCGEEPIGEWDDPKKWEDTMILAYLRDTRAKNKKLKYLSKVELGMEMIELDELFPSDKKKSGHLDFSELDPSWEAVTWYGASDAICTWKLYQKLAPQVLEATGDISGQSLVYGIEKLCVASTRWMERARIQTDQGKAKELIRIGQREWFSAIQEVYDSASEIVGRDVRPGYYRLLLGQVPGFEAMKFDTEEVQPGYMVRVDAARAESEKKGLDPTFKDEKKKIRIQTLSKRVPSLSNKGTSEDVDFPLVYDVLVPQELGSLLRECKVPGLTVTERSGQVATNQEELERVLEEVGDRYPFAAKIKRFREVSKALSTYLLPIIEDCAPDGSLRANFNAHQIDTGRFNAPSSKDPRVDGGTRFPFHGTPATYDPKRPECLARIRECIISRPGKFIAAIDFSGVELRIVTNLSYEPKWLREFFHCSGCDKMFHAGDGSETPEAPPPFCPDCGSDKIGDLHTLTGLSLYGEEAPKKEEWKALRGYAKACNFALCYGGGGNAVVTSIGCDKAEGWRIKDQFDKTYKVLSNWWKEQHKFAKKHKFVVTAFGRRYPVPDIDHEQGGFRSKAERNAVNGPVQATSADITKLAMGLVYKECKRRGWLEKVHMLITMHDELVFEIDGDILEEAIDTFVQIMCRNPALLRLKWPIPLTSDVEIGKTWMVPWDLKKMRRTGECPPELAGCFKNMKVKEKGEKGKETPNPVKILVAEKKTRVFKITTFSIGEVNTLAQVLFAGAGKTPANLKVEGPEGEDLTALFMTMWGGPLPEVEAS
jgi:DNA polymerase I-like protein with 3'-5' exonuclease and polymerase domains